MTFFSHRFNWRKVITGPLLLVAVANAACILVHSKEAFVALPFVRAFPDSGEAVATVEADAINLPASLKSLALLAMFAYFVAQGVAWAYLFLIGTAGGLSEQQVATGLTLSQVAGVAGALLPALVGGRFGRWRPLTRRRRRCHRAGAIRQCQLHCHRHVRLELAVHSASSPDSTAARQVA